MGEGAPVPVPVGVGVGVGVCARLLCNMALFQR